MEFGRAGARMTFVEDPPDPPDAAPNTERRLIEQERRARLRNMLEKLPAKNQKLLNAIFIEERPAEEVCDELGIDRGYLRVLLFRARTQLRESVRKAGGR
jgi:RNA polymerase sigma factor (sigma-70 family)